MLLRVHSTREGRAATVVHVTHDIDEAVYLADRVLVLSPSARPRRRHDRRRTPAPAGADVDAQLCRVPDSAERDPCFDRVGERVTIVTIRGPMSTGEARGQAKVGLLRVSVRGVLVALLLVPTAGSAKRQQQLRKITIAMIAVDPTAQAMYAKHRAIFRKYGTRRGDQDRRTCPDRPRTHVRRRSIRPDTSRNARAGEVEGRAPEGRRRRRALPAQIPQPASSSRRQAPESGARVTSSGSESRSTHRSASPTSGSCAGSTATASTATTSTSRPSASRRPMRC